MLNQIFEIRGYEKAQRDYDNQEPEYEPGTYCKGCGEFVDVEGNEVYAHKLCLSCLVQAKLEDEAVILDFLASAPDLFDAFAEETYLDRKKQAALMVMIYKDSRFRDDVKDFIRNTDFFDEYIEDLAMKGWA